MPYTPMMQQYFEIKDQYKDHLLFYRLGDFYEMFFDDALVASRELDLTLTGRDCGMEERAPMCGVPFHSADSYIARLVKKGYKVAVCEQLEDPALAKGIVKRDVIRIITPGTVTDGSLLVETKNNYLCALCADMSGVGMAVADITTADIFATDISFEDDDSHSKLMSELAVYTPSEVITNMSKEDLGAAYDYLHGKLNAFVSLECEMPQADTELLKKQFGEDFEEKNEIPAASPSLSALTALLRYIKETQKTDISYINKISYYTNEQFLAIDVNTRRNLELCEAMRTGEKKGTLLWVLDKTKTSAGSRLLRKWIEHPLMSLAGIRKRQEAVKALYDNYIIKEELALALEKTNDLERLMSKMIYGSANAKDMVGMLATIKKLPDIKEQLLKIETGELHRLGDELDTLDDIGDYIASAIVDDPPFSIREGGIIRPGFSADVDELHSLMGEGKDWIAKIEAEEREKTGIKNLKIGYNRVFGYYIEVTNSFKDLVPETYIRKQTLSGCERYVTDELKKMEEKILSAQDKIVALEYELFCMLREYITKSVVRVQKTAEIIAEADVYAALADAALKNNYVCPEVDTSDKLEIKDGRHPVVEKTLSGGVMFVPNDTELDSKKSLMLITGPNMAGKSTYMRQNALIVVMAQIGSFVPASSARIGIVDKVFTRVGASDDLASGQSTFMLEMTEVAYILKNATKRSFIVYDEIGRGTSTFDGMSIARSIAEYTASKIGAKTMFATHYHELTVLEDRLPGVCNYSIAAKKRGDDVVFLRKIVKGSADDSYGIEVAKLAGVPNPVIKRAKEVLKSLEGEGEVPAYMLKKKSADNDDGGMNNITIEDMSKNEVFEILKNLDINTTSPIEALQKLYELKKYTE